MKERTHRIIEVTQKGEGDHVVFVGERTEELDAVRPLAMPNQRAQMFAISLNIFMAPYSVLTTGLLKLRNCGLSRVSSGGTKPPE